MDVVRAIAFALVLMVGAAASVAQTNNATNTAQKRVVMVFLATYQG